MDKTLKHSSLYQCTVRTLTGYQISFSVFIGEVTPSKGLFIQLNKLSYLQRVFCYDQIGVGDSDWVIGDSNFVVRDSKSFNESPTF